MACDKWQIDAVVLAIHIYSYFLAVTYHCCNVELRNTPWCHHCWVTGSETVFLVLQGYDGERYLYIWVYGMAFDRLYDMFIGVYVLSWIGGHRITVSFTCSVISGSTVENSSNICMSTYLRLRLRSSHSCRSIGQQDFSTDSDHQPLCEHHSSWLESPVNLPGMFVARSSSVVLFLSCLHQVGTHCIDTLTGLSDGSRSICPASVILLSLTISDRSSIPALLINSSSVMWSCHEMPNMVCKQLWWKTCMSTGKSKALLLATWVHSAALISISTALRQTLAYTVRQWICTT